MTEPEAPRPPRRLIESPPPTRGWFGLIAAADAAAGRWVRLSVRTRPNATELPPPGPLPHETPWPAVPEAILADLPEPTHGLLPRGGTLRAQFVALPCALVGAALKDVDCTVDLSPAQPDEDQPPNPTEPSAAHVFIAADAPHRGQVWRLHAAHPLRPDHLDARYGHTVTAADPTRPLAQVLAWR